VVIVLALKNSSGSIKKNMGVFYGLS